MANHSEYPMDDAALDRLARDIFGPYERDKLDLADEREEAGSVTEPCARCHAQPGVEVCDYCQLLLCEGCMELHDCKGGI